MPVNTLIELRRGTVAEWAAANPTLAAGEPGFETDGTGSGLKIGDGLTAWADLAYATDPFSALPDVAFNATDGFVPVYSASTGKVTMMAPVASTSTGPGGVSGGASGNTIVLPSPGGSAGYGIYSLALAPSSGSTVTIGPPATFPPGATMLVRASQGAGGGIAIAWDAAIVWVSELPGTRTGAYDENWVRLTCAIDPTTANPAWYGTPITAPAPTAAKTVYTTAVTSATVTAGGLPGANDGVTPADGDPVLLTNQATGAQDGLWIVRAAKAWERPWDYATGQSVKPGDTIAVYAGTTYKASTWMLTNAAAAKVGTDATTWTQTSALAPLAVAAPLIDGTAPVVGTSSLAAREDHVHPRKFWTPSDHGLVTWTYDVATITSGTILGTAGTLYTARMHNPATANVSSIMLALTTAGSALTYGQCFACLFQGGNLIGVTPEMSGVVYTSAVTTTLNSAVVTGSGTAWTTAMIGNSYAIAGVAGTYVVASVQSTTQVTMTTTTPTAVSAATMTPVSGTSSWSNITTTTMKTMPIAPSFGATPAAVSIAAGDVYVGFYAVGSTMPTFGRGSSGTWVNFGLASNASRFGTGTGNLTGLTTTPPSSLGSPSNGGYSLISAGSAANTASWWVGLS